MTKGKASDNGKKASGGDKDKNKAKATPTTPATPAKFSASYTNNKTILAERAKRWLDKKKPETEKRLPLSFFEKHTVDASKQLLGKKLVLNGKSGWITETEAYRGVDDNDEAAHGFKKTDRSAIVYGAPATLYLYRIHTHDAIDIVVEPEGKPGCVLIRGVRNCETGEAIDGPGRVAKFYGVKTSEFNGKRLMQPGIPQDVSETGCFVAEGVDAGEFKTTKRVGISKATELMWRFVCE